MRWHMSRDIFISYKFNDRNVAHNVQTFFQPQGGICQGAPRYVENDVSDDGDEAIRREILRVMEPCVGVLFVVGNDSHNSSWIDWEAKMAIRHKKPMVALRFKGYTGGLPNRLVTLGIDIPFVESSQDVLCAALNNIDAQSRRVR
jgi:hypothetical protein